MNCSVTHKGIVKSVTDDMITVAIATESACGDCHAKNICGFTEISEKVVHVQNNNYKNINIGDEVHVSMDSSLGTQAVVWAYILPLVILVATLFIGLQFSNELIATAIALTFVVCYYVVLYKKNNLLERKFSFSLIQ